jgi:hypothetical protein
MFATEQSINALPFGVETIVVLNFFGSAKNLNLPASLKEFHIGVHLSPETAEKEDYQSYVPVYPHGKSTFNSLIIDNLRVESKDKSILKYGKIPYGCEVKYLKRHVVPDETKKDKNIKIGDTLLYFKHVYDIETKLRDEDLFNEYSDDHYIQGKLGFTETNNDNIITSFKYPSIHMEYNEFINKQHVNIIYSMPITFQRSYEKLNGKVKKHVIVEDENFFLFPEQYLVKQYNKYKKLKKYYD